MHSAQGTPIKRMRSRISAPSYTISFPVLNADQVMEWGNDPLPHPKGVALIYTLSDIQGYSLHEHPRSDILSEPNEIGSMLSLTERVVQSADFPPSFQTTVLQERIGIELRAFISSKDTSSICILVFAVKKGGTFYPTLIIILLLSTKDVRMIHTLPPLRSRSPLCISPSVYLCSNKLTVQLFFELRLDLSRGDFAFSY